MDRAVTFSLSLSIIVAAIIGLVRFKKINEDYQPFLFYVFASVINEGISFFLPHQQKKYALLDLNVFTLFEYCILLFQFYKWKIFRHYIWLFYTLLTGYIAFWLLQNTVTSSILEYNSYTIIVDSFIMVLLSINVVNQVGIGSFEPLYKNSKFIICIGLIIFFIYNLILNAFFLISDSTLSNSIFKIRVYINLLSNLFYAVGVFYMPGKNKPINFF